MADLSAAAEAEGVGFELRRAFRDGEFTVHFQPQVNLSDRSISGVEALVRWMHPRRGLLAPSEFLPAVASEGLMPALTRLVLSMALEAHGRWAAAGWPLDMAVNVRVADLDDATFVPDLRCLLETLGVDGSHLILEMTEEALIAPAEPVVAAMRDLADMGVRVAMDNFGIGCSSLAHGQELGFADLKLDRSLIAEMGSQVGSDIVRFAIDMGHRLGCRVVAEGIESDEVLTALRLLGCDTAQGPLLGRPVGADDVARLLRRQDADTAVAPPAAAVIVASSEASTSPKRRFPTWVGENIRPSRLAGKLGWPALIFVTVNIVLYGAWQIFRWGGHAHQSLIGDLAFQPVNLAATVYAGRAARRLGANRRTAQAWWLIAAALAMYALGDGLQLLYEVVLHVRAYPTFADGAYVSFYPLAMAGLLRFPTRRLSRSDHFKLAADVGIVVIGGSTVVWYLVLGQVTTSLSGNPLQNIFSVAYPVGDLVLLLGAATLLLRGAPRACIGPLRIMALGFVAFVVTDSIYGDLSLNYSYTGGDRVDIGWMVALSLVLLAAAAQVRSVRADGPVAVDTLTEPRVVSWLPYAALGVALVVLLLVGRDEPLFPLGGILIGVVALAVLVSVRQLAALRENVRLLFQYHELARTDSLTGVLSRRHFIEVAQREFNLAREGGTPLTAVMIDIDHFKIVNDRFGHLGGDRVLVAVSRACHDALRSMDVVARYGGDELVVLLPRTSGPHAEEIATRLCDAVARIQIPTQRGKVAVTLSLGVAEATGAVSFEELLGRADSALYAAKDAGRNCVRLFALR